MKRILPLLLWFAVAACGSSPTRTPDPDAGRGTFPVTIRGVTIASRPERIVSLSPTATEMLFAVGAGKQVIAVDDQSDYPAGVPKTSLSGFQPNLEAIAQQKPDLVVISNDPGDLSEGLGKLGIAAILEPAAKTFDDVYTQIEQIGAATGHVAEAARLVASMKSDLEGVVKEAGRKDGLTYYHELDDQLFTVTSTTFIGQVYGLFGLENIADEADKAASGYPQLSNEFVVKADPDVIFLADAKCCGVTAEKLAQRPGWNRMAAVRDTRVVALDDSVASRWGPRVVEFARTVADAVAKLEPSKR